MTAPATKPASPRQQRARKDYREARWLLPMMAAFVWISAGPRVGVPLAYLTATLVLVMFLDAERRRSGSVTAVLFVVGLLATCAARIAPFVAGLGAIAVGIVLQAAILRRTRHRSVPPEHAPAWNPDSPVVRELAPMPELQRSLLEHPPAVVAHQLVRRFDPRPVSVAVLCWATMAVLVGAGLSDAWRVMGLVLVVAGAIVHLQSYWPWARRVEVRDGRAVLRGRWRQRVFADASAGGKVVRARVVMPETSVTVDMQLWFGGSGKQTASFVESAWDTDALDAARRAVGFTLEVEPRPVPFFEMTRRFGRGRRRVGRRLH